ncbi:hypothetical protein DET54_10517 [Paenibacillus pabuli]|uniref:XkdX family protein n=1 Tax=Paenibacillus pabuli TaxID=1472 RepID=A0ABX9BKM3_9BACL|nr:hypothetical protein [Paenibacillus pabuli]RAI97058.1 hypothetical protein DET54_10517 [Paenibacillus pabuli]
MDIIKRLFKKKEEVINFEQAEPLLQRYYRRGALSASDFNYYNSSSDVGRKKFYEDMLYTGWIAEADIPEIYREEVKTKVAQVIEENKNK